ncbi:hypothetical protein [Mycobacteroides abscessus]|uniref:hypothetical protein n=1 Tax=Mycobacteroides abscessus TaxID=36809 RepID=UPI00092B4B98|nr:hypothetical protein [Mycobacteroides abscessus]SIB69345.1 Uncharacterised protein [Mycobacteroides abscessus subsp. abscessus]
MKIITPLESDDGHTRVHIRARGLDGTAKVSLRLHTIKSERRWGEGKAPDVVLPEIVAVALVLSFDPDELTVNGKTYTRWQHVAYEPERPDKWNDEHREVLTESGIQQIGYVSRCHNYGELTDSAREKLKSIPQHLVDDYLTNEAIQGVLVRVAKERLDSAIKEREAAQDVEQSARDHLAAMESLL